MLAEVSVLSLGFQMFFDLLVNDIAQYLLVLLQFAYPTLVSQSSLTVPRVPQRHVSEYFPHVVPGPLRAGLEVKCRNLFGFDPRYTVRSWMLFLRIFQVLQPLFVFVYLLCSADFGLFEKVDLLRREPQYLLDNFVFQRM